jgi:hypothetical protein
MGLAVAGCGHCVAEFTAKVVVVVVVGVVVVVVVVVVVEWSMCRVCAC